MRGVDAGRVPVEEVEIHLIYREGILARIQVAQGIDVSRSVVAHEEALGPVRETSLEVFFCLPMLMVVPDHSLEVPGIDVHPLVDLLGEVEQSRHKSHPFLRSLYRSGTSIELCVVVPVLAVLAVLPALPLPPGLGRRLPARWVAASPIVDLRYPPSTR